MLEVVHLLVRCAAYMACGNVGCTSRTRRSGNTSSALVARRAWHLGVAWAWAGGARGCVRASGMGDNGGAGWCMVHTDDGNVHRRLWQSIAGVGGDGAGRGW